MLADLNSTEDGYVARYERLYQHTVQDVWRVLTNNEQLKTWMPNLEVKDLRKDGVIAFHFNDGSGSSFDMRILEMEPLSVLEFEWGKGRVRFELTPKQQGTRLVLKDFFKELSAHVSKDMAGWHVCLDMFAVVLDGHEMDFPKEDWEKWYEQYVALVDQVESGPL